MTNIDKTTSTVDTIVNSIQAYNQALARKKEGGKEYTDASDSLDTNYYHSIRHLEKFDNKKLNAEISASIGSTQYKKLSGRFSHIKAILTHLAKGKTLTNESESSGYTVSINNLQALHLVENFTFGNGYKLLNDINVAKAKKNKVIAQERQANIESALDSKEGKKVLNGDSLEDLQEQNDNARLEELNKIGAIYKEEQEKEAQYQQGKDTALQFILVADKKDLMQLKTAIDAKIKSLK